MWKPLLAVLLLAASPLAQADMLINTTTTILGPGPMPCSRVVVTTYTYQTDNGQTYTQSVRSYTRDIWSPQCAPQPLP